MSNNRMYSPDMDNLNNTPSCDIFGYLMASVGVTKSRSVPEDIKAVGMLYKLRNSSENFGTYIDSILSDVIGGGCLDDYMEHLTFTPNEFVDSNGELLSVSNLKELI